MSEVYQMIAQFHQDISAYQFIDIVVILCMSIVAERTENWNMHIKSSADMLPYEKATGRNLYEQSALYELQEMRLLEKIA